MFKRNVSPTRDVCCYHWLSVYDVTLNTIYVFDVFTIFYFSFLSKPEKKLYKLMLNTIYSLHENEISYEIKAYIEADKNVVKKKKLTKARKERKKLFEKQKKTRLYLSIYSSALQLMSRYVKIF